MGDKYIRILKEGPGAWNAWRDKNPGTTPVLSKLGLAMAKLSGMDLSGVVLSSVDLHGASLAGTDLSRAKLVQCNLSEADLSGAKLPHANLTGADLSGARLIKTELNGAILHQATLRGSVLASASLIGADLSRADLTGAELYRAILSEANLDHADLTGADLRESIIVGANVEGAILNGCGIYGISAWNLHGSPAEQLNLRITNSDDADVIVDNLEVAQFMHLLLNNRKIRDIIDTITSKVVLILGRFAPERKAVLDWLRKELRHNGYLPVLFDFDKPTSRDLTETISTLAHISRFILADITDAKSIPQELQRIVPDLPSVPVQPLIQSLDIEYGMFEHFKRYPWVLPLCRYTDICDLRDSLHDQILPMLDNQRAPATSKPYIIGDSTPS